MNCARILETNGLTVTTSNGTQSSATTTMLTDVSVDNVKTELPLPNVEHPNVMSKIYMDALQSAYSNRSSHASSLLHPVPPFYDTLCRIYSTFLGLFEKQLTQKLEQFSARLDNFQRELNATNLQLNRVEGLLHLSTHHGGSQEASDCSICNRLSFVDDKTNEPYRQLLCAPAVASSDLCATADLSRNDTTDVDPRKNLNATRTDTIPVNLPNLTGTPPFSLGPHTSHSTCPSLSNPYSFTSLREPPTCVGSSFQPQLFLNQWMMKFFNSYTSVNTPSMNSSNTATNATTREMDGIPASAAPTSYTGYSEPTRNMNNSVNPVRNKRDGLYLGRIQLSSNDNAIGWNPGDLPKLQASSNPYRPYKVSRFRGRRIRGTSRSIWSSLYDSARVIGSSRRPGGPYTRPPYQTSVLSTGINALKPYKVMGLTSMDADRDINSRSLTEECRLGSPTDATNRCPEQTARCEYNSEPTRLPTSSHSSPTKAHNLVGNPIVILNPKEPREIFIGGIHTVPLPLWAYKKCLTMVRGEPHELGPRLCLRLLQSLFSLHYLVTHNYNGSGGKAPIDPTVMGAVLRQAQIQFGSGYFFTEPMALGKLRDYLNNAFRVMAFRQRKGERVRSPFWNEQGEPVHGLEAPLEFAETSDVIVLTPTGDLFQELSNVDERIKPSRDKFKLNSGNPAEWDKSDSS